MNGVGIIFNSVTMFVQLPDRTKTRVKRDDLDTLTEVFTGPSAYEDTFVPAIGVQHPLYSLMTVISSDVRRMPAAVSEVTVHYQGKLANSGATGYTSLPTISKYWMEGEVTYQVNSSSGYSVPMVVNNQPTVYNNTQIGIASYSRRYTGRCVQLAYITNRIPTGEPTQVGFAKGWMGFQNVWDTMTGFTPGVRLSGGGNPIWQMACTDVRVEDRADGWYRVTETYQSRMFPGDAGYEAPPPEFSVKTTFGNIASDTSNQNADTQPSSAISFDGGSAASAAQGAAVAGNYTLPSSPPGTAGATTTQQTGLDPAAGDAQVGDPTAFFQGDVGAYIQAVGSGFPIDESGDAAPVWTT